MPFPADYQAAEVVEPGKQALHTPSAPVLKQRAPILRLSTVATVQREHLDSFHVEFRIKRIAVIGSVADQPCWVVEAESGIQGVVHQRDLMWAGAGDMNGE